MHCIPRPALHRLRVLLLSAAAAITALIQPVAAQNAAPAPAPAPAAEAAAAPRPNYTYYAEFLRVVDANTVALDIDLGFGIWLRNQSLDLQGIPEPAPLATETAEQKASRLKQSTRLRDLLTGRTELILTTTRDKTTSPPRYLATLRADGVNVNEAVAKGE
ncbi:hypothetical protein WJU23_17000 [Prosthecobacter sp. SYSU 5D2]|uniref:hypothetical protein n=1 Tax=Prosthecobacter sp. SYSU 5D2 TaxID=3134134 RepID=UPI0031FE7C5C